MNKDCNSHRENDDVQYDLMLDFHRFIVSICFKHGILNDFDDGLPYDMM